MSRGSRFLFILFTTAFIISVLYVRMSRHRSLEDLKKRIVGDYPELVFHHYSEAHRASAQLNEFIKKFVQNPSIERLKKTRVSWIKLRESYDRAEVFGSGLELERYVNPWPIDGAYLDTLESRSKAGFIHQIETRPRLMRSVIFELHQKEDKLNVSMGIPVIEFLLWGEDLNSDGPGNRSYLDYVWGQGRNAKRRGQLLVLLGDILVGQLEKIKAAWDPKQGEKALAWKKLETEVSLSQMFSRLRVFLLANIFHDRVSTPFEAKKESLEYAPYSDHTIQSLVASLNGVLNFYLGQYQDRNFVGLAEFIQRIDLSLHEEFLTQMSEMTLELQAFSLSFDQALSSEEGIKRLGEKVDKLSNLVKIVTKIEQLSDS